ncbi:hypothetical protein V494_00127 [Pseudogymnoascus sp. VKM F-4513 (FW-928)]|nr:hypothetical protein V494_00127 [Pseudogymnoascus sp. VKM F-4513 (FW-928)]
MHGEDQLLTFHPTTTTPTTPTTSEDQRCGELLHGPDCHVNALEPNPFATGFIQNRKIYDPWSSAETDKTGSPALDDLDLDDVARDGDGGDDAVEKDLDTEEEKLEDSMKTLLFETLGPPLDVRITHIRRID